MNPNPPRSRNLIPLSNGSKSNRNKTPNRLTKEEAEALIQKIRDAERQRRAILRQREVAGQKPVEKDW